MSDSRQGPSRVGGAVPGPDSVPADPGAGNSARGGDPARSLAQDGAPAAVVGPFTARDVAVFVGVFITFVGSLLPLVQRGSTLNLWNGQNVYFIGIGILLPLVLAGLFVWRRLSPQTVFRVGSLSLDQFASVVSAFACTYFFVFAVTALTPGAIVGFIGGAILVASTVLARAIPAFAVDFAGRAEVPAHVVARDAVAPTQKPRGNEPGSKKPMALKPSRQSKTQQGGSSRFPAAAKAQSEASGAPAPRAGATAVDGTTSSVKPHEGPAGVSSAGAAAAATGAAGAAAAGASVAALAAGAKAAQGDEARGAAGREGEPATSAVPSAAGVTREGGASSPSSEAPSSETDGKFIGRHDSQAPSTAETPIGPAADDAVVLGGADGEPYGAPTAAARVEPTVEPSPASEPAPTQASPALGRPEPEPEGGPATQLAPAVDRSAGFEATRNYDESEPEYEAFWFAVNHARAALDPESGLPLFTLEPGQWILALQDRGDEFLVQSQDGRIGVLRDLAGIERG
ncbi:hypothetical protein [Sinomonas susongensis]|uniref:hypothetical protein n=1 Tax=Sinomonas susongensis TaxID=1324851 RepID=UPI001108997C|nr:hypothetical protein [Sinomonas susongensis]